MSININTQSSIRIEGTKVLFFDPFKVGTFSGDADIIFITHDHYDHLDEASIRNVSNDSTVFVAPESIKDQILAAAAGRKTVFLKAGDETEIGDVSVCAVPAYNKLKPFHPRGNGFLGYIVTMDNKRYYVAGDTDNVKELQNIVCDTALVPVGGTYTMNAKDAAKLVSQIRPHRAIPTHYGSIVGKKEDAEIFRSLVDKDIRVDILM